MASLFVRVVLFQVLLQACCLVMRNGKFVLSCLWWMQQRKEVHGLRRTLTVNRSLGSKWSIWPTQIYTSWLGSKGSIHSLQPCWVKHPICLISWKVFPHQCVFSWSYHLFSWLPPSLLFMASKSFQFFGCSNTTWMVTDMVSILGCLSYDKYLNRTVLTFKLATKNFGNKCLAGHNRGLVTRLWSSWLKSKIIWLS